MYKERAEVSDEEWQLSKDSADAATAAGISSLSSGQVGTSGASLERKQKAESTP